MIVWAFETLVATTLLMLFVLAIRTPVRRHFGPGLAYALWALPALRMILPPLPDSWHEGAAAPLASASDALVYYVVEPLGVPTDVAASGPAIWPWLLATWALGALAFIGYHLVSHGRFVARVRRMAQSVRTVAAGKVEVIETDAATGPLAFGVWRKYVAFPRDFAERYDPLERDLALAHELGHHARGDLLANWAALVMLALHWFNPVAWRAFRAFRADQEMACDALVLSGRVAELRHAYGRAIVKSAHGGAVSAACHLHTINEIKGRLRMLGVHERKSRSRLIAGAGVIGATMLGSLALTASGTQAAERVRTSVESAVGVDLASLELPSLPQMAPPAPPASPAPPVAPDAPDAPVVKVKKNVRIIMRDKDGKVTEMSGDEAPHVFHFDGDKTKKRMFTFRSKDGKTAEWDMKGPSPEFMARMKDMPELRERLKNMPEISSRTCSDGEGKKDEHVINRKDGDKRITIICTNRIERMASLGADAAARAGAQSFVFQRRAMGSALEGLRAARRSIEDNKNMSDTQRSAALSGIDEAIREMESEKND